MCIRDRSDTGFEAEFQAFLSLKREASVDVDTAVAEIIEAVRAEGHAAVAAYTERFDHLSIGETARFSAAEI